MYFACLVQDVEHIMPDAEELPTVKEVAKLGH